MKRSIFISLFIATHFGFIFLHIHKHTQFIQQTYAKQKNERLLASLDVKKQQLTQELHIAKNHVTVKEFAKNILNMTPIKLSQMKKVSHHEPSL